MKLVKTVKSLRKALSEPRKAGKSIGFVPTMGALHDGHASLMRESVENCDLSVLSIYVNPTQFGEGEDLDKYPKTLESDSQMAEKMGVDVVFAPTFDEMYPDGDMELSFNIKSMNRHLCGAKRPGHFEGVVQIVSKLFNAVRPQKAYFGLKDFQQIAIIRQLVKELLLDIEIVGCPIIREPDGLAMSSRNVYLNNEARKQAVFLYQTLQKVKKMAPDAPSVAQMKALVEEEAKNFDMIRLDYFEIVNGKSLDPIEKVSPQDDPVALIAAYCGSTRLIDNQRLFS